MKYNIMKPNFKFSTKVTDMNGTKRLTIKRPLAEHLELETGDIVLVEIKEVIRKNDISVYINELMDKKNGN